MQKPSFSVPGRRGVKSGRIPAACGGNPAWLLNSLKCSGYSPKKAEKHEKTPLTMSSLFGIIRLIEYSAVKAVTEESKPAETAREVRTGSDQQASRC
jgi:hypothetical protein